MKTLRNVCAGVLLLLTAPVAAQGTAENKDVPDEAPAQETESETTTQPKDKVAQLEQERDDLKQQKKDLEKRAEKIEQKLQTVERDLRSEERRAERAKKTIKKESTTTETQVQEDVAPDTETPEG